jgi:hypothetical protein
MDNRSKNTLAEGQTAAKETTETAGDANNNRDRTGGNTSCRRILRTVRTLATVLTPTTLGHQSRDSTVGESIMAYFADMYCSVDRDLHEIKVVYDNTRIASCRHLRVGNAG